MKSDNSANNDLLSWVLGEEKNHKNIDLGAWPDNQPCSGKVDKPKHSFLRKVL